MRTENKCSVYLEAEELASARRMAARDGLSVSSWIRTLIRRAVREEAGESPRQAPAREIEIAGEVEE